MRFGDVVKEILSSVSDSMTPQDIRDHIKEKYPDCYGTPAHVRNVKKGHYKNIDHALLAQIYTLVATSNAFQCDRDTKPMKVSLVSVYKPRVQPSEIESVQKKPLGRKYNYADKVKKILANAEKYHEAYYKSNTFRGPSLYFHLRALATRNLPASFTHLEYVYATLASWGMHRMSGRGSKMKSFEIFSQSVTPLIDRIAEAQSFVAYEMADIKWAVLREIFQGVKVMASGTTLVGNSKVMHHMLPNIVPPIDREYTLLFLNGNKTVKNDLESEWLLMKAIISEFFIPVASDRAFQSKARRWMARSKEYPWDTSVFKIVDNLVIGSIK